MILTNCGGGGIDANIDAIITVDSVGDCVAGTEYAEWIDDQTTWIYP